MCSGVNTSPYSLTRSLDLMRESGVRLEIGRITGPEDFLELERESFLGFSFSLSLNLKLNEQASYESLIGLWSLVSGLLFIEPCSSVICQ